MTKKEFIHKWFKDNDLMVYMDPFDQKMIKWYGEKLQSKLPELYQELVDKYDAPKGEYQNFVRLVEFNFNKGRNKGVMEGFVQ